MTSKLALSAVLLLFVTSVASAESLGHVDPDFGCVTQALADKYVQDFSIDVKTFGGLELCNNQVDSKKLFNDLQIIEQGQFDSGSTNVLIAGIIPADKYYSWMKDQTYGMARGNDIPYATAYNRGGSFTMQDGWSKSSTLGRVGVVIHEARHTAGYRHFPCKQGPYNGANLNGCDENYQQAGSHAVEMEYYARVSVAGENFHPVYKAMARLMAMGRANFVFNASPIHAREAVVAMDDSNTPVLFDQGKKWAREGTDFVGRLKRTSFGANLFNGLQAVALEMYELTGAHSSCADDYSYFKLLNMMPLGTLKDFEEFDQNQKRFVAAVNSQNQLMTYNFPKGAWNSATSLIADVERSSTTLPSGEQGYFLISKDAQIYSVNPDTQQAIAMGKSWDADVISVAHHDDSLLILKKNGTIYQRSSDGNEVPFDGGHYSQMVNVPLYDAFEVK